MAQSFSYSLANENNKNKKRIKKRIFADLLLMERLQSLESDSPVLEGRPSEALPVASEHGGDGDADENFGPSNLNAA